MNSGYIKLARNKALHALYEIEDRDIRQMFKELYVEAHIDFLISELRELYVNGFFSSSKSRRNSK